MSELKRSILKLVAKSAKKTALFSPHTMSSYFTYEPKMPEQLRGKLEIKEVGEE